MLLRVRRWTNKGRPISPLPWTATLLLLPTLRQGRGCPLQIMGMVCSLSKPPLPQLAASAGAQPTMPTLRLKLKATILMAAAKKVL
jgi:hypothetical protein